MTSDSITAIFFDTSTQAFSFDISVISIALLPLVSPSPVLTYSTRLDSSSELYFELVQFRLHQPYHSSKILFVHFSFNVVFLFSLFPGTYFASIMMMVAFSVVMTVLVLNFHYKVRAAFLLEFLPVTLSPYSLLHLLLPIYPRYQSLFFSSTFFLIFIFRLISSYVETHDCILWVRESRVFQFL